MSGVTVPLNHGRVALIDEEDWPLVRGYTWRFCAPAGCARANARTPDGKRVTLLLHRFLLDAPPGTTVVPINGDGLDCRRGNLCLVARGQQGDLRRRNLPDAPAYHGVTWVPGAGRWRAYLKYGGRFHHLGYFDDPADAARAADAKRRAVFGNLALTNFPTREEVRA